MSTTIRIDDEVYSWLQSKARPFEDTPNSVLRRIAGLDMDQHEDTQTESSPQKIKRSNSMAPTLNTISAGRSGIRGKDLNKQWNVRAEHALYHKDGIWYENLNKFPGALFDPYGYILFKSKDEYTHNPHISIGEKTNVRGGIHSLSGYIRKQNS